MKYGDTFDARIYFSDDVSINCDVLGVEEKEENEKEKTKKENDKTRNVKYIFQCANE